MAEIVDNRMYKEPDLRKLFRAYVRLAPMGDKDTVEVRCGFGAVPPTT